MIFSCTILFVNWKDINCLKKPKERIYYRTHSAKFYMTDIIVFSSFFEILSYFHVILVKASIQTCILIEKTYKTGESYLNHGFL